MRRVWLAAALCCFANAACAQTKLTAQTDASAFGPSKTVPLVFSKAEPQRRAFGKLEFLGGLEWSAPRGDFGGFSGMLVTGDQLTVLTDKAHWARARMIFNPRGGLAAIQGIEFWRLSGANGQFLQRPYTDAEALTRRGDDLLISFEGKHRVSRFAGLRGREQAVANLPDFSGLRNNSGLESLLALPDGRVLAIAEIAPKGQHHLGWILSNQKPQEFEIRRIGRFRPTDLTIGPDGRTLYLLERRFSLLGGQGMRIRRFALSEVREGAMIEGETLIEVGSGFAIDNMEALAARRGADGRTELFALSDDNFSAYQRTLLLHFRVGAEP